MLLLLHYWTVAVTLPGVQTLDGLLCVWPARVQAWPAKLGWSGEARWQRQLWPFSPYSSSSFSGSFWAQVGQTATWEQHQAPTIHLCPFQTKTSSMRESRKSRITTPTTARKMHERACAPCNIHCGERSVIRLLLMVTPRGVAPQQIHFCTEIISSEKRKSMDRPDSHRRTHDKKRILLGPAYCLGPHIAWAVITSPPSCRAIHV